MRACCALLAGLGVASSAPLFAHARDLAQCNIAGKFQAAVTQALGARVSKATYSMAIVRGTGELLCGESSNAELTMPPASTIKVLVAVSVLRRVDQGLVNLDALVPITQGNASVDCVDYGCGTYGLGKKLSVRRLLTDMIVASNNIATNQLVDLVGKPYVAETAQSLGAAGLVFNRKLYSRKEAEPGILTPNAGNAASLVAVYRELATGRLRLLSAASRQLLQTLLASTRFNDRLNALFPRGVRFFHKIGNTSQVSGDAGYFALGPNTFVLIAGVQSFVDYRSMSRIGRAVYDFTYVMR